MLQAFIFGFKQLWHMPLLAEQIDSQAISLFYHISTVVLIALVLWGIYLMSKVEKARLGNRIGALAMALSVALTLWYYDILDLWQIWLGLIIGVVVGVYLQNKVQMIQMPQMVGLLNGFGGLASMLAGILSLSGAVLLVEGSNTHPAFASITGGLAVAVGGLTWSGSLVAAGKLHRVLDQKPKILPAHQLWTTLSLVIALISSLLFAVKPFDELGAARTILLLLTVISSNLFGYFFAIRVGGADMPITISLLNSFSGVAGAIAGMAVSDILLVAVGGIVGASGLILTQIMCNAMNRKLVDILLGKTSTPLKENKERVDLSDESKTEITKTDTANEEAVIIADETKAELTEVENSGEEADTEAELPVAALAASRLKDAQKVIIVPGYGMALSQAQSLVKQLSDRLENEGKQIDFAIHPVAGRMPGHMNVLLAEVNIPYEKLREMEEINPQFTNTDMVIVVGANDVLNPAANTAEGTPIYGMPILDVAAAKHVLICNFDLKPGYAGVPNPLYEDAEKSQEHILLLLGDAKASLTELLDEYSNLS